MAFDWRRFVELARGFQQQATADPDLEALLRTALSRAYYGAFCYARNYAQRWLKFKPSGTDEDHRNLRDHLWTKKRQNVARSLDQLRKWRNSADYEDDLPFELVPTVLSALREADHVIIALPPPRARPSQV
jgi:hypothetical protein